MWVNIPCMDPLGLCVICLFIPKEKSEDEGTPIVAYLFQILYFCWYFHPGFHQVDQVEMLELLRTLPQNMNKSVERGWLQPTPFPFAVRISSKRQGSTSPTGSRGSETEFEGPQSFRVPGGLDSIG